jgi:hypothetical protein
MGKAALWLTVTLLAAAPGAQAQTHCKRCTAQPAVSPPPRAPSPVRRAPTARSAQPRAGGRPAIKPRGRSQRESGAAVELRATDITGNKELPKVMYIVPWKHPGVLGKIIEPPDSLVDEVLAPVDRQVFQRRIRYFRELHRAAGPTAGGAVAPDRDRRGGR